MNDKTSLNDHARSTIFAAILTGQSSLVNLVAADNQILAEAAEWLTREWEVRCERRERCIHMIDQLHSPEERSDIAGDWLKHSKETT